MSRLGTLPQVWCVALLLLVTGCTGDPPSTPGTSTETDSLAASAPVPAERCHKSGSVPVEKVVLTTTDGVHLAGARFGSGAKGLVLLPQQGSDFCAWFDYASTLVTA